MNETFKWGGHLPIVIVLLTMLTPKLLQMPRCMYQMGGIAIVVVSAPLLFVFGAPIVQLQVTLGQYAKLGPVGLWRAYPMGRGVAIAWLFLSFMSICQAVVDWSVIFKYIATTLSTQDFPWMMCDQSWNSENCRPIFENSTQLLPGEENNTTPATSAEDYYSFEVYDAPSSSFMTSTEEYLNSNIAFDTSSISSILLFWILISMPLVQGPKSLIKWIFAGFVIIHSCNALLFFLSLSFLGTGSGIGLAYIFMPNFNHLNPGTGYFYYLIIHGSWFLPQFGSLIFLGKHAEPATFTYPHILTSIHIFFVMVIFEAIKTSGFFCFYATLASNPTSASLEASTHMYTADFFDSWNGWFTSIPALLSRTSGANFWLLLHFVFSLLSWSVPLSLALEVIASSFAEFMPGMLGDRTKLPGSTILPFVLTALGFPVSICLLYLKTLKEEWQFGFNVYGLHDLFYMVFFFFMAMAIVPLSLSKVSNLGRENILSFVSHQGSQSLARSRRIITMVGVGLSVLAAYVWPLILISFFIFGYHYAETFGIAVMSNEGAIFVGVLFGAAVLVSILLAIVQCFLHCAAPSNHPCCSSLGRRQEPYEVPLEKPGSLELSGI